MAVSPGGSKASDRILGDHPVPPHPFAEVFVAKDGQTKSNVPHRALAEKAGKRAVMMATIKKMLVRHHASPEALERSRTRCEAMKRLGFEAEQARLGRFPTNDLTRKGNLAEVLLAEYVVAANGVTLPIYRLRYNPNVEQSMKGDDVLAFDLEASPVKVIVGEAKFRGTSSITAVGEIVGGLVRSYKSGLPMSLQFVADRLFESGQVNVGEQVLKCAELFASGSLRLDYVGLLMSDTKSADHVDQATPSTVPRLAMVSLGIPDPVSLIEGCYSGLG